MNKSFIGGVIFAIILAISLIILCEGLEHADTHCNQIMYEINNEVLL
jgi:hypothetical protein